MDVHGIWVTYKFKFCFISYISVCTTTTCKTPNQTLTFTENCLVVDTEDNPWAAWPKLKDKSWQAWEASKYTKKETLIKAFSKSSSISRCYTNSLWSPLRVPHNVGTPGAKFTENVSVAHFWN